MTKGERIKILREENNLTQEELAKKLHTTKQTISKYEKNIVTNIPSDRIEAIAKTLNSTPEYILGWEESLSEQYYYDSETAKTAQEIFENQNLRLLFDAARDASPEDLQTVHTMLLALKKKENN